MSSETIVQHCSPTLAGMKTGSLFASHFENRAEMYRNLRVWNKVLVKKGLRMLALKYENKRALIYVFRVSQLGRDLKNTAATQLLHDRGYKVESTSRCILRLMRRLKESQEFPHEIGLFLGYPPEDVRGFIENKAEKSKCVGTWKVYGDVEEAKKTFAKYRKCTDIYRRLHSTGRTLERLTVAG